MQKLVEGVHHFQANVFRSKRDLFRSLASSQRPAALFITCSDSRINPNLLTQTDPGDIFVLRNAGNIVPAFAAADGEAATIEFAIEVLGIRDVIVCGHSDCGAMKALLGESIAECALPSMTSWLRHAARTKDIMKREYSHLSGIELLTATVQENILTQIENLRTHPTVERALARDDVKLHGWVYKFETGGVFTYSPASGQFEVLETSKDPSPVYPNEWSQLHAEVKI